MGESMLASLLLQQNAAGQYSIGFLDHWWYLRCAAAVLIAVPLLVFARRQILTKEHTGQISYVIAFDITLFLIVGMALVVTASREWATACLCAGACLMGGGFLGLLFGVPYGRTAAELMANESGANADGAAGNASAGAHNGGGGVLPEAAAGAAGEGAAQPEAEAAAVGLPAPPPAAGPGQAPAKASPSAAATGRNLLEDTASSLSKLLTGASLVKIGSIYQFFQKTAWRVGAYVTDGNVHGGTSGAQFISSNIAVMGGALILYFLLLGFLSGLFLPAYFMKGWEG